MEKIILEPIGIIHSPYTIIQDVSKSRNLDKHIEAIADIKEKYSEGLKDLDGFSHAILLFYFHQSNQIHLYGKPWFEKEEHGVFSTRSPHRPNHIGMTIIKINRIEENKIYFGNVDMVNNTPIIDIKPYIKDTDIKDNVTCGWLEKHIAERTKKRLKE